MSTFFPPLKLCLISGNSTVASVHPVTVDESDTGPTAANYDAYQHLHTHTLDSQGCTHSTKQCLHTAWTCKVKASHALSRIISANTNPTTEKLLIGIFVSLQTLCSVFFSITLHHFVLQRVHLSLAGIFFFFLFFCFC